MSEPESVGIGRPAVGDAAVPERERVPDALAWPVADKERFADEHRGGWAMFMDRLARLLAERPRE